MISSTPSLLTLPVQGRGNAQTFLKNNSAKNGLRLCKFSPVQLRYIKKPWKVKNSSCPQNVGRGTKLENCLEMVIFSRCFSKIWLKTPWHKSVAMETYQDLDHQLYKFLPLIHSADGLQKLKVVESTVFEIMWRSAQTPPPPPPPSPPCRRCTKCLRTAWVNTFMTSSLNRTTGKKRTRLMAEN